jgi:hypothetical protein
MKLGDLKTDNEAFKEHFMKIQKLNPKGLIGNSEIKLNEIFSELLHLYKQKGYVNVDMSQKVNIFKSHPLIITNSRIKNYFDNRTQEQLDEDKNAFYLENLIKLLINRINTKSKLEVDENYDKFLKKEETKRNFNDIQKKIKKTLKYNKTIKDYFETKELKITKKTKSPKQELSKSPTKEQSK